MVPTNSRCSSRDATATWRQTKTASEEKLADRKGMETAYVRLLAQELLNCADLIVYRTLRRLYIRYVLASGRAVTRQNPIRSGVCFACATYIQGIICVDTLHCTQRSGSCYDGFCTRGTLSVSLRRETVSQVTCNKCCGFRNLCSVLVYTTQYRSQDRACPGAAGGLGPSSSALAVAG